MEGTLDLAANASGRKEMRDYGNLRKLETSGL
jgi:hypothetical protein